VILHVVLTNDKPISKKDIPVLCLADYIPTELTDHYEKLKRATTWVACQNSLHEISDITKEMWLERMLIERMEKKAGDIGNQLERNNGDWAETAYQWMARSFGFSVNALPFSVLAEKLPLKILVKHAEDIRQLEALLFGIAGFLNDEFEDEYPKGLKKEFQFLSAKYGLMPMQEHEWKLLRMRPDNFPCIRIAQFARLMMKSDRLFSKLIALNNLADVYSFLDITASGYWDNHFRFEVNAEKSIPKSFGQKSKELFIINTLVPLIFSYGFIKNQGKYTEKALSLLEEIKPEQNHITKGWELAGMNNPSAWHSQALLHLKRHYCDEKECLNCGIGVKILNKSPLKAVD
jgi:hypothetical protein